MCTMTKSTTKANSRNRNDQFYDDRKQHTFHTFGLLFPDFSNKINVVVTNAMIVISRTYPRPICNVIMKFVAHIRISYRKRVKSTNNLVAQGRFNLVFPKIVCRQSLYRFESSTTQTTEMKSDNGGLR